jgi:hypothetical protein
MWLGGSVGSGTLVGGQEFALEFEEGGAQGGVDLAHLLGLNSSDGAKRVGEWEAVVRRGRTQRRSWLGLDHFPSPHRLTARPRKS